MTLDQKIANVTEFCQSIFELRYKLRKMFQVKLKEAGISISFEVLEVMKVLRTSGNLNQQELADLLFKDKSSITYLIDNMVKAGLVTRREDVTDRRNNLIILTDKANLLKERLEPLASHCYLALAEELTDDEIMEGISTLAKMNGSMAEFIT